MTASSGAGDAGDTAPRHRGGIRRRVGLAMLAVAVVPLVLVAIVAYQSQRNAAEEDAVERLSSIAVVQEARVEAFAQASIENLNQIASRTQLRRSLAENAAEPTREAEELMNRILADAVEASGTTTRIELVALDGAVVASHDGSGIGEDRSGEPEFEDGLIAPSISNIEEGPDGIIGRHAVPMVLDGELLGVALVEASLDPLKELIADFTGLGGTGESVLIGRTDDNSFALVGPLRFQDSYRGQAIVTSDASDAELGRGAALIDGRFASATDYRDETVIAVTGPIDSVEGWGLIVKIDREEALSAAGRLGRILLVSVLIAVILVIGASTLLVQTLSRPILDLRDTAEAVRRGEMSRRAPVRGNDELTVLATEFNRMTDELTESNARLTLTNEQLEEFVYISSHDLKSPLRSIASFGQLLENRYGDALDDDGRSYLSFIREGATRMHGVIDDLLRYLRVEKEGQQIERVQLGGVLDAVTALHAPSLHQVDGVVDVGDLPDIAVSEALVRQLFDNIVQNAIRYRHPERQLHIRVRAERDEGDVTIMVSDNGLGVPTERREEAFEVFRKLHAYSPGTGMGLAICRRIARRHEGDVTLADSDLADGEEGLTVVVRLPAWAGDPLEGPDEPARPVVNSRV